MQATSISLNFKHLSHILTIKPMKKPMFLTVAIGLLLYTTSMTLAQDDRSPASHRRAETGGGGPSTNGSSASGSLNTGGGRGELRGVPQTGGRPTNSEGIPLGPSGKPMQYNTDFPTRSAAKDAARQNGNGAPIQHNGHFHSTQNGDKAPGQHYSYPSGGGNNRPTKN
ncbi:hypothetical protein [Spirosoma pulveris]